MLRIQTLAVALLTVVTATACFDEEPPPPPPPVAKGTLSGRILVDSAVGASVGPDLGAADNAARAAVAAATGEAGLPAPDDGDDDDITRRAGRLADIETIVRSHPDLVPTFREGDAIVHFPVGAHDRTSVAQLLEASRDDVPASVGLDKVTFTVNWCALRMFCLVKLTDDEGFLDDARTAEVVAALHKARPRSVTQVMRNDVYQGFRLPNDPSFAQQWNLQAMNLPAAWELSIGDPNLVIAVVDSGIVHDNPDIRERLTREPNNPDRFVEADFVDVSFSLDGDGPDLSSEDPGDNLFGPGEGQDSFHGTHTAGIIGAQTNNRRGVAGVTWEAQILPVRVLGDRLQGSVADILAGVGWAVGGEFDLFPRNQRPARVVNLSLGGVSTPSAQALWEEAFTTVFTDTENRFNKPVFIAAAGNSAVDARAIVPANVPRVITVGASRLDGLRASYSNFGPAIDVLAPGGQLDQDQDQNEVPDGVLSTLGVDLGNEQGTSMAAPHITGLAALIIAKKPDLLQDGIHNLIRDTANVRFRCNEGCGQGLADSAAALLQSGVEVQPSPRLALNAQTVVFNGGVTRRTISVLNLGSVAAPFSVTVSRGQAELFSVTPTAGEVAPSGIIEITIDLDRQGNEVGSTALVIAGTGAADGQQLTASLVFNDNPSRGRRGVEEVEVGAFARADDGGLVPVGKTIATRATNFEWEIKGLVAGKYEIYATGDDNFDGSFDSLLESIGAYPITTDIQAVEIVDEEVPVTGIDFGIRLREVTLGESDVGTACTEATKETDCAGIRDYAPDVGCIEGFPGGYCSRFCDDNICGGNGRCDLVDCDGTDCKVCLQRCVSDSQCREGYLCVLDTCVPPGFDVPG